MTKVLCCGRAAEGQLGVQDQQLILSLMPIDVKDVINENIRNICGSMRNSVLLTRDGLVYTAGRAEVNGRDGACTNLHGLVSSLEVFTIKSISCGNDHMVATTSSGAVSAWGYNSQGQCGQPPPNYYPKPTLIRPIPGIKVMFVSCGARHTLALCNDGEVLSWGDNTKGQLGHSMDYKLCHEPRKVDVLDGVPIIQIASGSQHNAALAISGSLFTWGNNTFGELGLGDMLPRPTPRLVKGMSGQCVRSVCCGELFTVVLTASGRVFTWGDGSYGQLGHGNTNQQLVPRQVSELMGIHITTIACGYNHVVAMKTGDKAVVWGWGSCLFGQLGTGKAIHNILTPNKFPDVWSPEGMTVGDIFCGGEQTFVRLSNQDKRLFSNTRVFDMAEDKFMSTINDLRDLDDSTQLTTYLQRLFGTVSNINSMFVTPGKQVALDRDSGINMARLRKTMSMLRHIKHIEYNSAMSRLLKEHIIANLPMDIVTQEQLRVYCILPELPSLYYPDDYTPMFAEAILNLPQHALVTLSCWYSNYDSSYFEALISVFKKSVYRSLVNRYHNSPDNNRRLRNIEKCLKVLGMLNEINTVHEIVKYNTFYIHELANQLDLEEDYRNWVEDREVVFCKYPFVYTASAKATLLSIDANQQMMKMVQNIAFTEMLSSRGPVTINPFLELTVTRDNLVGDTLTQLRMYESTPHLLKKPLKVIFYGEEGYDAGGVRKEFFLLLMKEMLSPRYGMFTVDQESHFIWFSELNFECNSIYELIGVLCGLAIYNSTIVDINFPPALYKKLLNKPVTLKDLEKLCPTRAGSLRQLLAYNEPDFEEVMCLNFTISRDNFGKLEEIDLIPNGSEKAVTLENKQHYVDTYVDYYLNKSISKQYEGFAKGFLFVAGGRVFKSFHAEELMHMVSGMKDFNFKELEQITEYKNGYSADHPVVKIFWEVFHEMDLETKKKFLIFLTGTDRVPIHGIHSMKIIIQKVSDNSRLPVAHTCFNLLDLPPYPNKEILQEKLYLAIYNTEGFGLV